MNLQHSPTAFEFECRKCMARVVIAKKEDIVNHTCTCKSKDWVFMKGYFTEEAWKDHLESFKKTFDRIVALFDYYVDMPIEHKKVISLWIIGTYMHDSFETYPFLFLNARKGSGKTRTERLISYLSKGSGGDVNTGISESALFRSEKGATLVLDECEGIASKEKQTLREYLQASYKKGATVTRMKKTKKDGMEDYKVEKFHPYRPIVMANINGIEDVLGDRCITLILDKSQSPNIIKIMEDFESNAEIKELLLLLKGINDGCDMTDGQKNTINGWNQYIKGLYSTTTTVTHPQHTQPSLLSFYQKLDKMDINGRNLELVFPLLCLVNKIFPERLEEFITIFKGIINQKVEEDNIESKDEQLIIYISQLSNWTDYTESKLLLQGFKEFIGWSSEEQWLSSEWLGRALKRLNLYSSKRKTAKGKEYLLNIQKAKSIINTNTSLQVDGGNRVIP